MPSDFRTDLIAIYARRNTDTIGQDPEYRNLCDQYAGNMLFDAARKGVHDAKQRLESRMRKALTAREQVGEALQELNQQRLDARPEMRATYYRLIVAAYKPSWNAKQQGYFEHAWLLLQSRFDYFLSFTTRYEPPGRENPLHQQYKYFILSRVDAADFKKADRDRQNLLALAVHRILYKPHMPVFFFEEEKHDNALVKEKLAQGCRESLVFVQLVQGIMFKDTEPATNFCFFEYDEAGKAMASDPHKEERFLFIVAENAPTDLPAVVSVPRKYEAWREHVAAKAAPHLGEVPHYDRRRIEDLTETLRTGISTKLMAARERIWRSVPVDLGP